MPVEIAVCILVPVASSLRLMLPARMAAPLAGEAAWMVVSS